MARRNVVRKSGVSRIKIAVMADCKNSDITLFLPSSESIIDLVRIAFHKHEVDQGFFVKNGDGSADAKPIAHLYKTQVYALARHLGLPEEICATTPTTDTYSMPQGQDEFYFALPYQQMDVALWSLNNGVSASDLAEHLAITEEQAQHIYDDIRNKRNTTRYLHSKPFLIEKVEGLPIF